MRILNQIRSRAPWALAIEELMRHLMDTADVNAVRHGRRSQGYYVDGCWILSSLYYSLSRGTFR